MKCWLKRLAAVMLLFLLAALGYWLLDQSKKEELARELSERQRSSVEQQQQERVKRFERQLATADSLEELQLLEKTLEQFSKSDQERLGARLNLALAIAYFDRAEEKIARVQSIVGAIGDINSIANQYMDDGFRYYQEAKNKIDALEQSADDKDYNFHLFYARGNIYYRYLALIAGNDEKQEVFNQTVLAWREALVYREKDIDTEINLEILNKSKSQLLSDATQSRGERIKMLPNQGVGLGRPQGVH